MVEKDYIKDLFAEKLANAEAQVNPELWSAISSNIATSSTVASGLSTTAKFLIGLGTAASVTVATVLLINSSKDEETPLKKELTKNENKIEKTSTKDTLITKLKDYQDNFVSVQNPSMDEIFKGLLKNIDYNNLPFYDCCHGQFDKKQDSLSRNIQTASLIATKADSTSETNQNKFVENKSAEAKENISSSKIAVDLVIGELKNTFTPSNDGVNDYFEIELEGLEDFALTVLNQKNEVVFKSNDINFKWDGRDIAGELVPQGQYIYFFTGKDSLGNPISKYSSLTIIKR